MKKWLNFTTILVMILMIILGCSSPIGRSARDNETSKGNTGEGTTTLETRDVHVRILAPKAWYTWMDQFSPTEVPVEDVVTPTITEFTGVSFDTNSIITNNGINGVQRMNMFLATDDLPEIVYAQIGSSSDIINTLVKRGKVWQLDDYLEKYAPNVVRRVIKEAWEANAIEGKTYGISSDCETSALFEPRLAGTLAEKQLANANTYWQLVIRDDLLKAVYGDAVKTNAEMAEILKEKGEIPKEAYDTPIQTTDDLLYFLRTVKAMDIKMQGKSLIPLDMWTEGWWVLPFAHAYGFQSGVLGPIWDKEKQSVYYAPETLEFKEYLKFMNTCFKEGLMDQETFVMSNEQRKEKLFRGLYAVTHFWQDVAQLNQAVKENGDNFEYRLVQAPYKDNRNSPPYDFKGIRGGNLIMISKKVSEEEMIQLLKWIDFQYSEEGEELMAWGPEEAGLWEIVDGKKKFKNQELMDYFLLDKRDIERTPVYYGLCGGALNDYELGRFTYLHRNIRGVLSLYEIPPNPDNIYGEQWKLSKKYYIKQQVINIADLFIARVPEWAKITGEEGIYGACKNEWAKAIIARTDEEFEKAYQEGLKRLEDLGLAKAKNDLGRLIENCQR